ncbi:YeeE/YedE family protein [Prosthecomicrobium hirschii]|uniref:YeeE/YedE family protein n=1 Tax=Prosthecodimorpha hirschii TaxID=665126 RepID=UPI00221E969A|nr:YeeE/YedE family protein [Prosthecomicrobium hirschii]MCW1842829.1 YeeE/YedE family protein [Prosthecomicrobium hirschii]
MSLTATSGDARSVTGIRIDWTPYLVGVGIGVLSWLAFAVVNAPLGITTALSQVAGGAATPILGADAVAQNAYWKSNPFTLDYGTLFLVGTFFGGMASALAAGSFRFEVVPQVWRERFGGSPARRLAVAFLGGLIAMYGARLANGCTSGNGISGGLQLAVSGWTFLAAMFATGLVTAALLFRKA